MSLEWLYTRDGKTKSGPISSAQLQALAKSGQLQPNDMVLKSGTEKWLKACQIKGLFPGTGPLATAPASPANAKKSPTHLRSARPATQTAPPLPEEEFSYPEEDQPGRRPPRPWYKTTWFLLSASGVVSLSIVIGVLVVIALSENPGGDGDKGGPTFALAAPPYAGAASAVKRLADTEFDLLERKYGSRFDLPRPEVMEVHRKIKALADPLVAAVQPPPIALDPKSNEGISEIKIGIPTYEETGFSYFYFPISFKAHITIQRPLNLKDLIAKHYDAHGTLVGDSIIFLDVDAAPGETVAGKFAVDREKLGQVASFKVFWQGKGTIGDLPLKTKKPDDTPPPAEPLPDLATLLKMLDNPNERPKALDYLGRLGTKAQAAVLKLIPLLKNDDADVRRAAAVALEKIGPPAKVDYEDVIAFLKDENPKVRVYVVKTAVKMEEVTPGIITALAGASKDTEVEVRLVVVTALARFATFTAVAERVMPLLLNALTDNDVSVRQYVKDCLTSLKLNYEEDFEALKGAAKHSSSEVRLYAIDILATPIHPNLPSEFASPAVVDVFVSALKDSETTVRKRAIEGLGKANRDAKPLAFPALLEALNDRDKLVQTASLASLAKLGLPPPSELPGLVKCLTHANTDVRLFSLQALSKSGRIKEKPDVAAVAEALKDEDKRVARLAAEVLGNQGAGAGAFALALQQIALKEKDKELRRHAVFALGKIGRIKGSVEALASALDDQDLRSDALASLEKVGPLDKTDVAALTGLLKSSHLEVRSIAVSELGKLGADALKALEEGLGDKEKVLRIKVASALGAIKGKDAAQVLTEAFLKEQDAGVRRELALALSKLGPDAKGAVESLTKSLLDKDREVRRSVAVALVALGANGPEVKAAIPKLLIALKEIPFPPPAIKPPLMLKVTSVSQQKILKAKYDKELEEFKKYETFRAQAQKDFSLDLNAFANALASIGKEAVPDLTNALKDKKYAVVRLAAALALGQIGPEAASALPVLALMTSDPAPEVRLAVEQARSRIRMNK